MEHEQSTESIWLFPQIFSAQAYSVLWEFTIMLFQNRANIRFSHYYHLLYDSYILFCLKTKS